MTANVYPLMQVIGVKQRRVEEAEKVLREKKDALKREQEKLKEVELAREKVKQHYNDKLAQLRQVMDEGTNSAEILQMKNYLKVVQERLKEEDKRVAAQKEQVAVAEKNVQQAKENLKKKEQEVDKLLTHKKDWELEMRKEMEVLEAREQDEMGNIIYIVNARKRQSL